MARSTTRSRFTTGATLFALAFGAWGYHRDWFGDRQAIETDATQAALASVRARADTFLVRWDGKLAIAEPKLSEFRRRAGAATDDRKPALLQRVQHFERQREMVLRKIDEYRTADEDRRQRLRREIDTELDDFNADLDKALKNA